MVEVREILVTEYQWDCPKCGNLVTGFYHPDNWRGTYTEEDMDYWCLKYIKEQRESGRKVESRR